MLVFSLSGIATSVQAGMISTQYLLESDEREKSLNTIRIFLEKESVRDQLIAMGVSPDEVSGRIDALTNSELSEIEQNLDVMRAGGNALAVIGVVFLVLLILELVGVTNVFTRL
jgi:flavin-dependent dehydrogenase